MELSVAVPWRWLSVGGQAGPEAFGRGALLRYRSEQADLDRHVPIDSSRTHQRTARHVLRGDPDRKPGDAMALSCLAEQGDGELRGEDAVERWNAIGDAVRRED